MIRIIQSVLVEGSPTNGNALYWVKGYCLSADVADLPKGYALGSEMYVVDDGEIQIYNESTESWAAKGE